MTVATDALLLMRALSASRNSGPFKLTVAVTYVCHQRCTHCRIWQREKSNELTAGEWRQVWRHCSKNLSWLDLTGGEVTDREDFSEIAIAAIEECPELTMLHYPSNGSRPDRLVDVTRAISMAQPKRLVLSISMDGPPKLHDKLRGRKGAFEAAVESFCRVKELGPDVYFGMTLSPWNMDQLEPTFDSLKQRIPSLNWRDFHVNFLHHSDHYFGNTSVKRNDPVALKKTIDAFIARRGAPRSPTHLLEHLFLRRVGDYMDSGRSPMPCSSMSGHAFINPEGQVYPCHIWDKPVGSLRDHQLNLLSLWDSNRATAIRNDVQQDKCPGCWTPCEAYPSILANLPRV